MYRWKNWMEGEGGYRDVMTVAIPLVLSTSAWTIQHFIDRMFLAWYSPDAVGASMAAGILHFTLVGFFLGTSGYINTFVSQYTGANRPQRVGPAVWQGLYFAIGSTVFAVPLIAISGPLFDWGGHAPEVAALEKVYFSTLCYGMIFQTTGSVLSCFYTGRRKTWTVMWVNLAGVTVNIILDYCMIFGNWGFPAMGIRGAAIATVAAWAVNSILFAVLISQKRYRERYATLSGWRLDPGLFKRFLCYGLPSGAHLTLDVLCWSLFIFLIGRIGKTELAISSIVFNINMLAFVPMIGIGIAITVLTGQYLGQGKPEYAARATWSASHVAFTYMIGFSLAYVLVPNLFLAPFAAGSDPVEFEAMRPMGIVILRFVAFYCVFDTMNIVFAGTLKGAGDTRFIMWMTVSLGWTLMVVPMYAACMWYGKGVYAAWTFATIFITTLGFGFLWRFIGGKWKSMRVIEPEIAPVMGPISEAAPTELA